jgi:hypothetical protein
MTEPSLSSPHQSVRPKVALDEEFHGAGESKERAAVEFESNRLLPSSSRTHKEHVPQKIEDVGTTSTFITFILTMKSYTGSGFLAIVSWNVHFS